MAEIKLSDIDFYDGIVPTVFKKVDLSDTSITPFKAYKSWTITSGSATSSCLPLAGIYSDINALPALDTELTFNDLKNIDSSLQTVTYYSINHLFYKNKTNLYHTFGPTNSNLTKKNLYHSASIFSIPYTKIGEGIKAQSFQITTSTGSINLNLQSDLYSNIIDTQINTSSIISNVQFYEGFNEYFDVNKRFRRIVGPVEFVPGVTTTAGASGSIGYAAKFSGNSSIIIPNTDIPGFYDRNNNYAISFFVSASSDTAFPNQALIHKNGTTTPYFIYLNSSKRLVFFVSGESGSFSTRGQVSSSTAVSSSWNHVVCQKSGSYLQIYINGTLNQSVYQSIIDPAVSASIRIDNTNPIRFGTNFSGSLDEIRIYNKALTATEIGYLADRHVTGSLLQTNIVGNVFNKQGIAVISSPNYIYNNLINTPFTASYKSTVTRYELSTIVRADSSDFNMSLNRSLTKDDNSTYLNFVSGSSFSPYITTIGLYDDYGRLLAIGKLAQPIKKRNDVDMNFLIRMDLDKGVK
jgi:hypothetical protein